MDAVISRFYGRRGLFSTKNWYVVIFCQKMCKNEVLDTTSIHQTKLYNAKHHISLEQKNLPNSSIVHLCSTESVDKMRVSWWTQWALFNSGDLVNHHCLHWQLQPFNLKLWKVWSISKCKNGGNKQIIDCIFWQVFREV